ncbi:MAG: A/G-specific adenine glycosylase [Chloroflexi bacterium]|nr:A/G-specific adenine glycosylase [Chloroflexota bacterium]
MHVISYGGRTMTDLEPTLGPKGLSEVRSQLLDWYERESESFPWRDARNPYWALVAGVCSQQTQMSRARPLWERWVAAFPTVHAVAAASPAEVLRVWGSSGYPRRAVHLHEACRRCVTVHGGQVPRDEQALLALPGVGPFTAAIVRCFGYGEDTTAIDTNVVRLLGRLVHGDLQPAKETPPREIAETARWLTPAGFASRWNPALMDYGAQVCTPRPDCEACVVARFCAARPRFEAGEEAEPVRAQARFEGSDRQLRGRIMAALRDSAGPVRTALLARDLASDAEGRARVRRLLEALCDEGLAWQRDGSCGLDTRTPEPVAAEELA